MHGEATRRLHMRRHAIERQIDEIEFFWKREVLGQQPIGRMRARIEFDERVVFIKTEDLRFVVAERVPDTAPVDLDKHAACTSQHRLADRRHQRGLAIEEQAQTIDPEAGQGSLRRGEFEGDRNPRGCIGRQAHILGRARRGMVSGFGHADGGDVDIAAGAEFARHALDRPRHQQRAARNAHRGAQLRSGATRIETRNRAGRKRPQVMRVQHFEQGFGELWKLVVEFLVHPGGQQRKRFEQTLDMRVFDRVTRQCEPPRHLGVAFGKFARMTPQKRQLAFVMWEKIIHLK